MDEQIEILKALGERNRLTILDMISCEELCISNIIENMSLTEDEISDHINILKETGLINEVKKGHWMYYSINREAVGEICKYIKNVTGCELDGYYIGSESLCF